MERFTVRIGDVAFLIYHKLREASNISVHVLYLHGLQMTLGEKLLNCLIQSTEASRNTSWNSTTQGERHQLWNTEKKDLWSSSQINHKINIRFRSCISKLNEAPVPAAEMHTGIFRKTDQVPCLPFPWLLEDNTRIHSDSIMWLKMICASQQVERWMSSIIENGPKHGVIKLCKSSQVNLFTTFYTQEAIASHEKKNI